MTRCLSLAAIGALSLLAACDERTPAQQAAQASGQPMEIGMPSHVADAGPFKVFHLRVPGPGGGASNLWVVSGSTVAFANGKSTTTVAHVETGPDGRATSRAITQMTPEVLSAIEKLSANERIALGLPDPADPRLTGLAKLSAEERRALGLGR